MAQKYQHPGPWDEEPDELVWTDEKTGMNCRMLRNHSGAWCGYVRIPEGHPLYNVEYNAKLPESLVPLKEVVLEGTTGKRGIMEIFCLALGGDFHAGSLLDVHGSVTFSGEFKEGGFWYGFDCSHAGDCSPKYTFTAQEEYRDLSYVKAECASLAKQLKQVQG